MGDSTEFGSSHDAWASSRKYRWKEPGQAAGSEEDRRYTQKFQSRCPVDSSQVEHTVTYIKATCSRVDDMIDDFHCNRNSTCVKCMDNYRLD